MASNAVSAFVFLSFAAGHSDKFGAIGSAAVAYSVRRSVHKKLATYFTKSFLNSC